MKTSVILPLAFWAASGALAWKDRWERECKWYGTAPFCGESAHSVNDKNQGTGEQLIVTTEEMNRVQACYKVGWPSELQDNPCLDDYGSGCITGYKRLWCKI